MNRNIIFGLLFIIVVIGPLEAIAATYLGKRP